MDLFLEQDPHIRFTNYVVQEAMPEAVECDAYIVTGSRLSVYDDEPWIFALAQFIARALNRRKKLIGICFGHQLMAHFFGGLVAPAPAGMGRWHTHKPSGKARVDGRRCPRPQLAF